MARFEYAEKAIKVSRREFLGAVGVAGAMLWTGVYAATDLVQDRTKYIKLRLAGIYKDDEKSKVRQSHNNKAVKDIYDRFVGQPLSPLAEELFHTQYVNRITLL